MQPDSEKVMTALCVKCQKEKQLEAWFWDGEKYGYGDYDLQCHFCKHIIHKRAE